MSNDTKIKLDGTDSSEETGIFKKEIDTKTAWEWFANITLAAVYLVFIMNNVHVLMTGFKLSVILLLLFNTAIFILAIARRKPKAVSTSIFHWLIAFMGTFASLMLIGTHDTANEHVSLLLLQSFGII